MTSFHNLVLIGGGHTHAIFLKLWANNPVENVHLTVINPNPKASYSGMLPGFVAGHYQRSELEIDVEGAAKSAHAQLVLAKAQHIDRQSKQVHLSDGTRLPYDFISIDIGITTGCTDLSGFHENGVAVKPLDDFAQSWDMFRKEVIAGKQPAQIAVIGGGVAGAEISMAMATALARFEEQNITLIDRGEILSELRPNMRKKLRKHLKKAGVSVVENTEIGHISPTSVRLSNGTEIPAHLTISATGARAYKWLEASGLTLHSGFICVSETLQSSDPSIFAVGDCAHLTHAPRPKAGVFAVRQAPLLFHNLTALLQSEQQPENAPDLRGYHPQKDYLKLISLGKKSALAQKFGLSISGALIWKIKDKIDRDFMSKFNN